MDTSMSHARTPAYSIRRTAWLLGITTDEVSRAIRRRQLHAIRRRSQVVIPLSEISRVLGGEYR